ncbi:MAG: hypothetical protein S0880_02345 [Actinomycetota bacterium]|nr:hypothetical protein [Actinomycetota bacterium]
MFVVLLRFTEHKSRAAELMDGHNAWIRRGFDDGVFLMAGSLQPGLGGAVVAHGVSRDDLERRVGDDPFVAHGVVAPEICEITPGRTDARLDAVLA